MKKETEPELPLVQEDDSETNNSDTNMPNPVKKPKTLLQKILIWIVLLGVLAIIYFAWQEVDPKDKLNSKYSSDQQRIVSEFGLPDTFQVVKDSGADEKTTRSEIWRYLKLGEVFLFENGQFSARTHQDFNLNADASLVTVKIEPADVYNLITLEEINQLLGGEPNYSADINQEVLANAQLYNYDNLVTIGLVDNKISWVRTFAGVSGDDKNADTIIEDEPQSKDTLSTNDEEWKKGRVFSEDEQFSVFVDVDVAQNLVALKELQNEAYTHHFCYSGEDVEEDFFCNGWGRPLFSIIEYSEANYQQFLQTPFADTELVLAKKDGKVYTFTHPNGDVPAIIMGRADDFYDTVMESFVFTDEM